MYVLRKSGNTVLAQTAQWGHPTDANSITVTGACGLPSDIRPPVAAEGAGAVGAGVAGAGESAGVAAKAAAVPAIRPIARQAAARARGPARVTTWSCPT